MTDVFFPLLIPFDKPTVDNRVIRPPASFKPWGSLPLPIMLAGDGDDGYQSCVGALRGVEWSHVDGLRGWGEISAPERIDSDKTYWPGVDLADIRVDAIEVRRRLRKVIQVVLVDWCLVAVTLTTRGPAWKGMPPAKFRNKLDNGSPVDYR